PQSRLCGHERPFHSDPGRERGHRRPGRSGRFDRLVRIGAVKLRIFAHGKRDHHHGHGDGGRLCVQRRRWYRGGIVTRLQSGQAPPDPSPAVRVMNLLNTIVVGLKEIWAHKFRSLLTMLGIILGVASLVGMAAVVKGMENGLKETMIAMGGADKVLLDEQDVPAYQEHLAEEAPGRTMADVLALRRSAPLIRLVSPEMGLNNCTLTRGDKMVNPS